MGQQDEQVELAGVVVGDDGVPVAGWIQRVGGARHWLAKTVEVRVEGRVVEISALPQARFAPIERREGPWGELEQDPLLAPLISEAPAPDVEVRVELCVLRGGDSISVWGTVHGRDFVAAASSGEAFRTAPERAVVAVAAQALARGDGHAARLAELRQDLEDEAGVAQKEREADRLAAVAKAEREAAAKAAKAAKAASAATANRDRAERAARSPISLGWATWIALAMLGGALVLAPLTAERWVVLAVAALAAMAPVVVDAALVPSFHRGTTRAASLELPRWAFALASGCSLMFAIPSVTKAEMQTPSARWLGLIGAWIAAGMAVWCWRATTGRQRRLRLLATAPAHPSPIRDDVWGVSDGTIDGTTDASTKFGSNSAVIGIGDESVASGNVTKDAAGVRSRTIHSSSRSVLARDVALVREQARIPLRIHEAEWLSMEVIGEETKKTSAGDHWVSAVLLRPGQSVRVAGRARDGELVRGGEASLLVFGASLGRSVEASLRGLVRRAQIASLLAAVGLACLIAATVSLVLR